MKEKRVVKKAVYHVIVFVIGIIMIYPLIWMVMSSFKENSTIFSTAGSLIPGCRWTQTGQCPGQMDNPVSSNRSPAAGPAASGEESPGVQAACGCGTSGSSGRRPGEGRFLWNGKVKLMMNVAQTN